MLVVAATLGLSAAAAFSPAAATVWDWCSIRYAQCSYDCDNSVPKWEPGRVMACLNDCNRAQRKCGIRQSVTIPLDSDAPVGGVRAPKLPTAKPRIPAGGILDDGAVLGTRGPAATGSPVGGGAPKAPPVVIR
jgi:hypothetical protein